MGRIEVGAALAGAFALVSAAGPAVAGNLVIYQSSAEYAAYVPLPGAGKYLFEFTGSPTSGVTIYTEYYDNWDTFAEFPSGETLYLEGNESPVNNRASLVAPSGSYLFDVPEEVFYVGVIPEPWMHPSGLVPAGSTITRWEHSDEVAISYYIEDLGEVPDPDLSYSLTITQLGAIPEPVTWGFMLLGFGVAGARLRSRRAAFAVA